MKTEFERLSNRLPMEMLSMKRYYNINLFFEIFFLFIVMNYQHLHQVNKLILQHGMNVWKIPMLNLNINKHGKENI